MQQGQPFQALDHVAGYTIVNDVSERAFQMERAGTTTKGKSADSFGPVGPWLVTADEVGDPQALAVWTDVNGERRQDGNTANMVFNVRQLVAYVSRFMALEAGDLISTGTPAGSSPAGSTSARTRRRPTPGRSARTCSSPRTRPWTRSRSSRSTPTT